MGEWDAPHLVNRDSEIMPLIQLCNIASGGHAGSRETMIHAVNLAKYNKVKIGVHPGYEDRPNFGRKYILLKSTQIQALLRRQLSNFYEICDQQGVQLHHVKMHGALYHASNAKEMESDVLIQSHLDLNPKLRLIVGPNSLLEKKAIDSGIRVLRESFIDRSYSADLSLVPRSEPNASIIGIDEACLQYDSLKEGWIKTKDGKTRSWKTDTACVHGDNPNVVSILKRISLNAV